MKNKKEEEKKLNELTPQMVERITIMTQTLTQMKATGKTVNEQTIKELALHLHPLPHLPLRPQYSLHQSLSRFS